MKEERSTSNEDGIEPQDVAREDNPSKENAIEIREEAPTIRGILGETRPHPEFVTVTCDFCQTSGFLSELAAAEASRSGQPLICPGCKNTATDKAE